MTLIHETLTKHYEEVIYVLYNNTNHYNAVIPKELQHADPRRPPMQIKFPHLPPTKQLQQYLAESQITSALSLSSDLLTDTTQLCIMFSELNSSSLSSLSARLSILRIRFFGRHVSFWCTPPLGRTAMIVTMIPRSL